MGFHGHGGTPIAGWLISMGKSQSEMEDLLVPSATPIYGNLHWQRTWPAKNQPQSRPGCKVLLMRKTLKGWGRIPQPVAERQIQSDEAKPRKRRLSPSLPLALPNASLQDLRWIREGNFAANGISRSKRDFPILNLSEDVQYINHGWWSSNQMWQIWQSNMASWKIPDDVPSCLLRDFALPCLIIGQQMSTERSPARNMAVLSMLQQFPLQRLCAKIKPFNHPRQRLCQWKVRNLRPKPSGYSWYGGFLI